MNPTRILQRAAPAAAALALPLSAPASADQITLIDGDRLNGTIVERHDDVIIFDHDLLGRIELDADHVASVGPDLPSGLPRLSAAAFQDAPPAGEDDPWSTSIVVGLNGSFGNVDTQSFHAGIDSVREMPDTRLALDLHYYYGASSADRTDNKLTAGFLHDWLVHDSRWLYFVDGRYDYDEFQSWEHRLSGHGGLGYELIQPGDTERDLSVIVRGGVGVVKEFNSSNDDLRPELFLGADAVWQITERQLLKAGTTFYPELSDIGEFRVISYIDWEILMDAEANMSLTAGFEHEHQSQVGPGREHNDFRIVAGLQFDY